MVNLVRGERVFETRGRAPRDAFIALGSSMARGRRSSEDVLTSAVAAMEGRGLSLIAISDLYVTEPVGGGRQPRYLNAVARMSTNLAPATLLRTLKSIERAAGRRLGRHWGPRILDLDIIAVGATYAASGHRRRVRGQLILPHPEMHRRAFVLLPLQELSPRWWHPKLGRSLSQLIAAPHVQRQMLGVERQSLSPWRPDTAHWASRKAEPT